MPAQAKTPGAPPAKHSCALPTLAAGCSGAP